MQINAYIDTNTLSFYATIDGVVVYAGNASTFNGTVADCERDLSNWFRTNHGVAALDFTYFNSAK